MFIKNGLAKIRLKLQIWQMDNNFRKFQYSASVFGFGWIFTNLQLSALAKCENAASVIHWLRNFDANCQFLKDNWLTQFHIFCLRFAWLNFGTQFLRLAELAFLALNIRFKTTLAKLCKKRNKDKRQITSNYFRISLKSAFVFDHRC